jgi:hypothetical protein
LTDVPWPPALKDTLHGPAIERAMWEMRHQRVLGTTLGQLGAIGIRPILIKGTALAYSLFLNPVVRERGDTDLLVPASAKASTDRALLAMGYERSLAVSGEYVSYQASYTMRSIDGSDHTLDLHWKINNSELLSRLFSYEELLDGARPLPKLSDAAYGPSPIHSLLIACMHRATHKENPYYVDGEAHYEADRLIWLYDIHLLANTLDAASWARFLDLATRKGLRAVCLEALLHAQASFKTIHPPEIITALARTGPREAPAQYLDGGKWRRQWMDICALPHNSARLRLLRELLVPSATYVRGKYADDAFAWLPWLYAKRVAGGIVKRLPKTGAPR